MGRGVSCRRSAASVCIIPRCTGKGKVITNMHRNTTNYNRIQLSTKNRKCHGGRSVFKWNNGDQNCDRRLESLARQTNLGCELTIHFLHDRDCNTSVAITSAEVGPSVLESTRIAHATALALVVLATPDAPTGYSRYCEACVTHICSRLTAWYYLQ